MSAHAGKPFVPWETPDYSVALAAQEKELRELSADTSQLERQEAAADSDASTSTPQKRVTLKELSDAGSVAVMVEAALCEAALVVEKYRAQGFLLTSRHHEILQRLASLSQ